MKITSTKGLSTFIVGMFLCSPHTLLGMKVSKTTLLEQAQRNCAKKNKFKAALTTQVTFENPSSEEQFLVLVSEEPDESHKAVIGDEQKKEKTRIYGVRPPTPYPHERPLSPEEDDNGLEVPLKNKALLLLQTKELLRVSRMQDFVEANLKELKSDLVRIEQPGSEVRESVILEERVSSSANARR